jgi:fatty acid desaturase
LLVPKLQRHLELHATSLALNPAFIREVGPDVHRTMVGQQLGLLLFWAPLLTLLLTGVWSPRIALCWLVIATAISLTNAIRSLGAHRYLSDGLPLDRAGQHADSIDTPGAWWTILWAPVGHRFHALHHYAPGLPYHNLGAAYRRLARFQESAAPLIDSTSPSLVASLRRLWSTAGASEPRRG